MRNSQRGFVGTILVIILTILIIGGGYYFYKNNSSTKKEKVSSVKKEFVHESGAFSFQYPSNFYAVLRPSEKDLLVALDSKEIDTADALRVVSFSLEKMPMPKIYDDVSTGLTIDGFKAYRINYPHPQMSDDNPVFGYMIQLNDQYYIYAYVTDKAKADKTFSMNDLDMIINTLSINKDKIQNLLPSASSVSAIIISAINGSFSDNNILNITDINGKKWVVDYTDAILYYQNQDMAPSIWPGDITAWLKDSKTALATGKSVEGQDSIKITGAIDKNGIFNADTIIQHVQ